MCKPSDPEMEVAAQLFTAVRNQSVDEVRSLLDDEKYDPSVVNSAFQTLVFYAVQNPVSALELCKLLVEQHGVEANSVDSCGQTALFFLAKSGNIDCLLYLVRHKCDVNHQDQMRQTPLFYAASKGKPEMIRKLVWEAADPNHTDKLGQTPLFYAHSLEVSRALLNTGADAMVHDASGKSAAECADEPESNRSEVASFLKTTAQVQKLRGRIVWTYCADGSIYMVQLAQQADVDKLCALEEEFIQDHKAILNSILKTGSDEELCGFIGLSPFAATRRSTILDIAKTQQRSSLCQRQDFTLQCMLIPPVSAAATTAAPSRSSAPVVVGYLYCKLQDKLVQGSDSSQKLRPCMAVISHLKVDRQHQGRGCATLLVAGMLRFLEKRGAQAYLQQLQLSVVKGNVAARRFYEKLGFVEIVCDGSPVTWLTMVRAVGLAINHTLRGWLALVPGGACGQGLSVKAHAGRGRAPGTKRIAMPRTSDDEEEDNVDADVEEQAAAKAPAENLLVDNRSLSGSASTNKTAPSDRKAAVGAKRLRAAVVMPPPRRVTRASAARVEESK